MRAIRTKRYKLIHNLNYNAPFPIDQDFYISPSFQDILNRTRANQPLFWFKNLGMYYYRPEWELFDLKMDAIEVKNLADDPSYNTTLVELKMRLLEWQKLTKDPWICSPHAVYEDKGLYKDNPQCLGLDNEI
ncbi:protein of unknown function (DUF4976) [Popillia japonica]|uniref:N-sulphoglucosamine sulphohydrolase C-terminal domain-containing protein n=1 Tax=Popillia japonica TaxID=7064 RepID=A0AAW1L7W9_POPJA